MVRGKVIGDVVRCDFTHISAWFLESFNPQAINDCIVVRNVTKRIKRFKCSLSSLSEFLNSPQLSLYIMLTGERQEKYDYRKAEELKQAAIIKYVNKKGVTGVKAIIDLCAPCETDGPTEFSLRNGVAMAFNALEANKQFFLEAVEYYLYSDTPLRLYPHQIVAKLFEYLSVCDVELLLEKYEYAHKPQWAYMFFYHLPEAQLNADYLSKFYNFLKEANLNEIIFSFDFLDRYEKFNEGAFLRCCYIISAKGEYSVFGSLFLHAREDTTDQLVAKFEGHYSLLSNIYLNTLAVRNTDYDGSILNAIYCVYPSILEDYVRRMVSRDQWHDYHDNHRIMSFWRNDNYIDIMDNAIKYILVFCEERLYAASSYVKILLSRTQNSQDITERQDGWIKHYIECYSLEEKEMELLFAAIATFAPERRKPLILYFTQTNPDFEAFRKIPLEESSWGWSGSMIPYMEERIVFLESLLQHYHGVKFLHHKQKIINNINRWRKMIEQEQIDEMLRGE